MVLELRRMLCSHVPCCEQLLMSFWIHSYLGGDLSKREAVRQVLVSLIRYGLVTLQNEAPAYTPRGEDEAVPSTALPTPAILSPQKFMFQLLPTKRFLHEYPRCSHRGMQNPRWHQQYLPWLSSEHGQTSCVHAVVSSVLSAVLWGWHCWGAVGIVVSTLILKL